VQGRGLANRTLLHNLKTALYVPLCAVRVVILVTVSGVVFVCEGEVTE